MPKLPHVFGIIGLIAIVACSSGKDTDQQQYYRQSTSVAVEDCKELSAMGMQQHELFSLGQAVFACAGPAQYSLYLVDDGTRSWYVVDRNGGQYSLDEEIVYGRTAGNFPNVGISKQVEWLLDSQDIPVGLVFSVSYQKARPNNGRFQHMQQYLAYSLMNDKPLLVSQHTEQKQCRRSLIEYLANH